MCGMVGLGGVSEVRWAASGLVSRFVPVCMPLTEIHVDCIAMPSAEIKILCERLCR